MMPDLNSRANVFISYSHSDSEWLQRLRVHLTPIGHDYEFIIWDDTKIKPGSKWNEEIENALKSAKIAILLISADFLASNFINTRELPHLLEAASNDGAIILPVIISPSSYHRIPALSQFQSINTPSRPMINLTKGEQEDLFVKITECVENALTVIRKGTSLSKETDQMPKENNHKNKVLEYLNRLINEAQEDGFLILSIGDVYVQFTIEEDLSILYCETVSNQYLPQKSKLKKDQTDKLLALGLNYPDSGHSNFYMGIYLKNKNCKEQAALVALSVFFQVHNISEASEISFKLEL